MYVNSHPHPAHMQADAGWDSRTLPIGLVITIVLAQNVQVARCPHATCSEKRSQISLIRSSFPLFADLLPIDRYLFSSSRAWISPFTALIFSKSCDERKSMHDTFRGKEKTTCSHWDRSLASIFSVAFWLNQLRFLGVCICIYSYANQPKRLAFEQSW